jgi:hypothetical protein
MINIFKNGKCAKKVQLEIILVVGKSACVGVIHPHIL